MAPFNIPAEVWFQIFNFLPLADLKTVMLVCKDFYSVCERETLWKNVILSRRKLSRSDAETELSTIKMERFKFKQKINIKDYIEDSSEMEESQKQTISRNLLTYCCSKDHVEELSLHNTNLSHIGVNLLEKCILRLKTVNLSNSSINQNELTTILSTIPYSSTLKSIDFSYMSFSNISPRILQEAVKHVEYFHVNQSNLTPEQCENIVQGLESNPNISSLGLASQHNMRLLPNEALVKLISQNLKILNLNEMMFNTSQIGIVLHKISEVKTLIELDIKGWNFSEVDTTLVAATLSDIEKLRLMEVEFGPGQGDALLKHINYKQKTKEINLYGVNLKDVDKTIFAETLKRIEQVVLSMTDLTYEQIVGLLQGMKHDFGLRNFTINNHLVKKVDIKVVCDAIITLEHLTLMVIGMERKMVTEMISTGELFLIFLETN